ERAHVQVPAGAAGRGRPPHGDRAPGVRALERDAARRGVADDFGKKDNGGGALPPAVQRGPGHEVPPPAPPSAPPTENPPPPRPAPPSARRAWMTARPTNPVPPVTKTRRIDGDCMTLGYQSGPGRMIRSGAWSCRSAPPSGSPSRSRWR